MSPKLRKKLEEMEGGGYFQQLLKSALIGVSDYIVRPTGFLPSKVKYGWLNRPMDMPPLYDLVQMVASTYDDTTFPQIQGYRVYTKTPTMTVFRVDENRNVFILALRGTQFTDINDLTADMAIIKGIIADASTARNVRNSNRYQTDVSYIREVQDSVKEYLQIQNPIYYAVGHSLSGTIIDELLKDGLISSAVSFNPAIERVNLGEPNNNHRVYLECDVLYNLLGKFITNGNLEVISKANPAGADAGPIDTTKGSLECHNIRTVIPLMSGKGFNNNIGLSYKPLMDFFDKRETYPECEEILQQPVTQDVGINSGRERARRAYDECVKRKGATFQDLINNRSRPDFRPIGSRGGGFLDDIVSGFARFDKGFKNSTLYDPSPEQKLRDEAAAARGGGVWDVIKAAADASSENRNARAYGGAIDPATAYTIATTAASVVYKLLPKDAKDWVDGAADTAKGWVEDTLKEIFDPAGQAEARRKAQNDATDKAMYDKGFRYDENKQVIQVPDMSGKNRGFLVKIPDPRKAGGFVFVPKATAAEIYSQLKTEERIKRGQQGRMGRYYIDRGEDDPEEVAYQACEKDPDCKKAKEDRASEDAAFAERARNMGPNPRKMRGGAWWDVAKSFMDSADRGAEMRKKEENEKWNDGWAGKIGIPNPARLFGFGGPADVLRYGRGKKFSQKQLTKIILDKNKVIADLEENAYSGKGNELGQFYRGEIDAEDLVRRLGESVAAFRRRVAEGPRRRRERQAAQEAHDNEQRERLVERGRFDELATRLLACVDDRADLEEISRIRRVYMAQYGFAPRPSEVWGQLLNFGTNSDRYPRLAGPQAEVWLRRNNC
jgi:hypothetical protein